MINQRVSGDTGVAHLGLNLQLRGKCHNVYSDPDFSHLLDLHVIKNPDFSFERHGSRSIVRSGTVNEFLKKDLQSISFAAVPSPTNSHERTSWNFAEIIEHILRKHTNVIRDDTGANGSPQGWVTNLDFDFTNSTNIEVFIVRKTTNLWSTLQRIGGGEQGGGEFYELFARKDDTLVYRPSPMFRSDPSKITLSKSNIRGTVRVRQRQQEVGQVELSAVKDSNTVFTSRYPQNPTEGKVLRKTSGVWADDQARCNLLAQRLYEWHSRPYTLIVPVDPSMILFDGGLELSDRVTVQYDGPAESLDTGHGVSLNINNDFFIYQIAVNPSDYGGTGLLTLEYDNGN